MSSIESLKEQARRHEQKEEWKKALDLYRKAIEKLDEAEQPDIGLHNRAGDLQVRLGDLDGALGDYERAIDLYMESELPNNAIAVCKKVLRNVPGRPSIHLRIGEIRASQGFLTDARTSFLTYAEAMQKAGDIDAALTALGDFADLAPEDTDLRMMIAGQMEQHGQAEGAVEQLMAGWRSLAARGLMDEAEAFEARIRELDPSAELPDPSTLSMPVAGGFETTSLAGDPLGGFGEIDLDPPAAVPAPPVEEAPDPGLDGLDETPPDEEEEDEAHEVAAFGSTPEGFETTGLEGGVGGAQPFGDLPGIQDDDAGEAEAVPAFGGDDDEVAEPLPTFGTEVDGDLEAGEALPTFGVEDDDDLEAGEALPTFGMEDDDDLEAGEALPTFGDEADEHEEAAEPLPTFGTEDDDAFPAFGEVEDGGEDAEPLPTFGYEDETEDEVAAGAPPGEEAADAMAAAAEEAAGDRGAEGDALGHEMLAERGDLDGAMQALRRLLAQDPDDLGLRQRMVEYAFRGGDESVLVPAYLDLAAALERAGQGTKARSVYQQVLSTDPDNERARAALGGESAAPASPVREVASSEDYVDLGSLILGDDEEEKSTRFVVAYEEPSGDEEADFAKMLSQFKAKVAETFSADDVRAHHDLGTAYKEMGLLDEAISEFQQALRASADHLPTYELLGQCFMEKGEAQAAARTLSRALEVPDIIEDDLLGIYYHLGRAHEELGNPDRALEFYDKVFALDINFADVTERLRALR